MRLFSTTRGGFVIPVVVGTIAVSSVATAGFYFFFGVDPDTAPASTVVKQGGAETPDSPDDSARHFERLLSQDVGRDPFFDPRAFCADGEYSSPVSGPITDPIGADGPKVLCVINEDGSGRNVLTFAFWVKSSFTSFDVGDAIGPSGGLDLFRVPAFRSNAASLSASVRTKNGSPATYRYKILSLGPRVLCANGEYSDPVSGLITGPVGRDGPKILCVVPGDESGQSIPTFALWFKDSSTHPATGNAIGLSGGLDLFGVPFDQSSAASLSVSVRTKDGDPATYRYKVLSLDPRVFCADGEYGDPTSGPITGPIGADGPKFLCVIPGDGSGQSIPTFALWIKDSSAPSATGDVIGPPGGLDLFGVPAGESSAAPFAMTVRTKNGSPSTYRYKILSPYSPDPSVFCADGEYSSPVSGPITDPIGEDGPKILCVIHDDGSGRGVLTSISWVKDSSAPSTTRNVIGPSGGLDLLDVPVNLSGAISLTTSVRTKNGDPVTYRYKILSPDPRALCANGEYGNSDFSGTIIDSVDTDGPKVLCVTNKDEIGQDFLTSVIWVKDSSAPLTTGDVIGSPKGLDLLGVPVNLSGITSLSVDVRTRVGAPTTYRHKILSLPSGGGPIPERTPPGPLLDPSASVSLIFFRPSDRGGLSSIPNGGSVFLSQVTGASSDLHIGISVGKRLRDSIPSDPSQSSVGFSCSWRGNAFSGSIPTHGSPLYSDGSAILFPLLVSDILGSFSDTAQFGAGAISCSINTPIGAWYTDSVPTRGRHASVTVSDTVSSGD